MASHPPQARRTLAVRGLLVLGGVLLLASLLFGWANRSFFDRDGFTTRSMAALDQPAVQGRLAEVVSHRVVEGRPRLENAQPLIAAAIEWIISTMQFRDALEEAASFLHNQLFEDDPDRLALRIRGIIERLRQVLEVVAPDLAAELPSADSIDAPIAEGDDLRAELVDVAEAVGFLAFVLPLLALGAFGLAVYLARDRTRALMETGVTMAVVALLVFALLAVVRVYLTESTAPENVAAVKAVLGAFTHPLRDFSWVLLAAGAGLAAWAWSRSRNTPSQSPDLTAPSAGDR